MGKKIHDFHHFGSRRKDELPMFEKPCYRKHAAARCINTFRGPQTTYCIFQVGNPLFPLGCMAFAPVQDKPCSWTVWIQGKSVAETIGEQNREETCIYKSGSRRVSCLFRNKCQ